MQLKARLTDSDGNAVDTTTVTDRPIIRVLQLGSYLYVASLAAVDGPFSYRGGHWNYTLRSKALPGPGRYWVYMTTPNSEVDVFDQLCIVEVTVR